MTKDEFRGFSSGAQHDMILEALVRVSKNLEELEKDSSKPFVGSAKQRKNDLKLMTILADGFVKNELIWDSTSGGDFMMYDDHKYYSENREEINNEK